MCQTTTATIVDDYTCAHCGAEFMFPLNEGPCITCEDRLWDEQMQEQQLLCEEFMHDEATIEAAAHCARMQGDYDDLPF